MGTFRERNYFGESTVLGALSQTYTIGTGANGNWTSTVEGAAHIAKLNTMTVRLDALVTALQAQGVPV